MFDGNRRLQVMRAFVFLFLGSAGVGYGAEGPAAPTDLRCEYLSNPMGADVQKPRFSWVLHHTERAQMQTAYQILIAGSADGLARDGGNVWDSRKVDSSDSTQVVYAGKSLSSGKTYYWKVRYWDTAGNASPYSAAAQFEMGLLSRDEWKGQWIEGNLLRKEIDLQGKIVRARAYVTALGYYELRINGEKVGRNVLDPALTTYPKRVLYTTYDVTRRLRSGRNAIGVMLGGGWATLGRRLFDPESGPTTRLRRSCCRSISNWKAGRQRPWQAMAPGKRRTAPLSATVFMTVKFTTRGGSSPGGTSRGLMIRPGVRRRRSKARRESFPLR